MLVYFYNVFLVALFGFGIIGLVRICNESRRYEQCRAKSCNKYRFDQLIEYGFQPEDALRMSG